MPKGNTAELRAVRDTGYAPLLIYDVGSGYQGGGSASRGTIGGFVLQDTNAQLSDVDAIESKHVQRLLRVIAQDSMRHSDFAECRNHTLYKTIMRDWNTHALKGVLSALDEHPWVAIFLLQDITKFEPYEGSGDDLEAIKGSWKKWARTQGLLPSA
ncbi:MAG: hypothetical protein IT462_00260 [Planctomycetes bacterium]|nr:hypothetical protein [Planctomycetota bacterium]